MNTNDFPLHTDLSIAYRVRESSADNAALILLLHGVGSNELDLLGLHQIFDPRFHVVSARAPHKLEEDSYSWFHIDWLPELVPDAVQAEESRQLLLTFIDELSVRFGVDHKRIILAGFSQGAIMSFSVALTSPERVAAIIAMSGRVLPDIVRRPDLPDHGGLPILLTHGQFDDVLPIHHAHASREILEKLNVELDYREYPVGHFVSQESLDDILAWLAKRLE